MICFGITYYMIIIRLREIKVLKIDITSYY